MNWSLFALSPTPYGLINMSIRELLVFAVLAESFVFTPPAKMVTRDRVIRRQDLPGKLLQGQWNEISEVLLLPLGLYPTPLIEKVLRTLSRPLLPLPLSRNSDTSTFPANFKLCALCAQQTANR